MIVAVPPVNSSCDPAPDRHAQASACAGLEGFAQGYRGLCSSGYLAPDTIGTTNASNVEGQQSGAMEPEDIGCKYSTLSI